MSEATYEDQRADHSRLDQLPPTATFHTIRSSAAMRHESLVGGVGKPSVEGLGRGEPASTI